MFKLRDLARYAFALALVGCLGCHAQLPETKGLPLDRPPPRMLVLHQEARGDTSSPDERAMSSCKSGGRAGQSLDHLYGFEVKETASYRFELVPSFDGVLQVQQHHPKDPWYFGIGCAASGPGKKAIVSVPLEPGLYWVVVDGNLWDEDGPYSLKAEIDTSSKAQIGAEDPAKITKLLEQAKSLKIGERTHGIYRSSPGGARTSCGLLNGNGLLKLSLDHAARLRIHAAAHFSFSLELRPAGGGAKPICIRTENQKYATEIVTDAGPGEYSVVLDSLEIAARDPYSSNAQPVSGAYILDVEEVAP